MDGYTQNMQSQFYTYKTVNDFFFLILIQFTLLL